ETPLSIDGGGGKNTLDYSRWTSPSHPAAWFKGEGNTDDASGGPAGVAVGDVVYAAGEVGQSFSLNGVDSYVQVPNSPNLEPANVSVEAWVNSTTLGRNKYILDKGADG